MPERYAPLPEEPLRAGAVYGGSPALTDNGWFSRFGKKPKRGKGTKAGPPVHDDTTHIDPCGLGESARTSRRCVDRPVGGLLPQPPRGERDDRDADEAHQRACHVVAVRSGPVAERQRTCCSALQWAPEQL